MRIADLPFGTTDWASVARTEHPGDTGVAHWQTRHFGPIRARMVTYSPGYLADHWCKKGHILLCLEGELHTDSRYHLVTVYEVLRSNALTTLSDS